MSAGPQLSESPAQPFGCQDLQLPKLCLPCLDPFSPVSPGRLKPDKKGQMQLPLDKSLQVRRELLGTLAPATWPACPVNHFVQAGRQEQCWAARQGCVGAGAGGRFGERERPQ